MYYVIMKRNKEIEVYGHKLEREARQQYEWAKSNEQIKKVGLLISDLIDERLKEELIKMEW